MHNLAATLTRTGQTAAKRAQGRESREAFRQLASRGAGNVVWIGQIRPEGDRA